MNGGQIYIDVRANYSAMERDLVEAEQTASTAAEKAADQYQSKFGAWLERSRGGLAKKIEGFINPIQLLDRVADFAEQAGEQGIGTALDNLAESVPVVGAAYRIGKSIGGALLNAFGEETEDQFAERITKELEAAQKKADARRKIAESQEREASATFGLGQEAGEAEFNLEMSRLERAGEKQKAIFLRGLREEERLQTEMEIRVADAANDEQKDSIRRIYEARIQSNADEVRDRVEKEKQAEDEIAARQLEAQNKQSQADIAAAQKAASEQEKIDRERARSLEQVQKDQEARMAEAEKIEQERISSQSAGVTGFQTALGTFKFDAYPDADKRRNDERMVRALESLSSAGATGGFV